MKAFFMLLALGMLSVCTAAERNIYPDPQQAQSDVAAALKSAAAEHRRVIVDFGGNWCPDCRVLDSYLHDGTNRTLLDASYVLVHVNIGRLDRNLDLAERLQVPLMKGVPALAVLEPDGTVLYSQRTGEFQAMRHMETGSVTEFLRQWKPASR